MVLDAPNVLGSRSGAAWVHLGLGPETLLGDFWPLLAGPGRSKIGPGAVFGRLRAVLSASQRFPVMVLSAQNRPRSKFHRFFIDFGGFLVDF